MRALALLLALTACGSSASAPAPAAGPSVRVVVDDALVATVPAAELAARPLLAALVSAPPSGWRAIEAIAGGGRTLDASRLDATHPGEDAIAYLDGGAPAFGFFRRGDALPAQLHDLAGTPTVTIAGVTEIRIRTHEAARAPAPPTIVQLRAGDRRCALDDAALATLPALPDAHARGDRPAWDVRDLAAHCFTLALRGVHAGELSVDAATLARSDRRVVAKLNRRGQLVVRVLEEPGGRVLAQASPDALDLVLADP